MGARLGHHLGRHNSSDTLFRLFREAASRFVFWCFGHHSASQPVGQCKIIFVAGVCAHQSEPYWEIVKLEVLRSFVYQSDLADCCARTFFSARGGRERARSKLSVSYELLRRRIRTVRASRTYVCHAPAGSIARCLDPRPPPSPSHGYSYIAISS